MEAVNRPIKIKKPHPMLVTSSRTVHVASIASFCLAFLLMGISHLKVPFPIFMLERFFPGTAWIEISLLSLYAAWLTAKMLDPAQAVIWRPRIWTLFTIVFFGQLALGLIGFKTFLMTGKLHLPVPALILAGPLYRGGGLFMLILFLSTVVLVGPAWCSHLCYVGSWDDLASRATKKPVRLPRYRHIVRTIMLLLVMGTAIGLNLLGVRSDIAFILALAFGLLGVVIMLLLSRHTGQRVHCVAYCPMGLIANLLGKLHPFRMRIGPDCTKCRACQRACRCEALTIEDIENKKPGISCTLCGDCVAACRHGQMAYRFFGLSTKSSRIVFIVMVVSIHAAFLGIARI